MSEEPQVLVTSGASEGRKPFDPENPDLKAYFMCDGAMVPCQDEGWQPMVKAEWAKVLEYGPKLKEKVEDGAEEMDLVRARLRPHPSHSPSQ